MTSCISTSPPQPERGPAMLLPWKWWRRHRGVRPGGGRQQGPSTPCPILFCWDEVLQRLQYQTKGQRRGTEEEKQLPSSSQLILSKFLHTVSLNSSITVLFSFLSLSKKQLGFSYLHTRWGRRKQEGHFRFLQLYLLICFYASWNLTDVLE